MHPHAQVQLEKSVRRRQERAQQPVCSDRIADVLEAPRALAGCRLLAAARAAEWIRVGVGAEASQQNRTH